MNNEYFLLMKIFKESFKSSCSFYFPLKKKKLMLLHMNNEKKHKLNLKKYNEILKKKYISLIIKIFRVENMGSCMQNAEY